MRLRDFTIEYRKNPIGLDVNPRFSWKLESDQKNVMQIAYRVRMWRENFAADVSADGTLPGDGLSSGIPSGDGLSSGILSDDDFVRDGWADGKRVWDTGRVKSDRSVLVPYRGETLLPFTRYHVHVAVWDNQGETGEACGFFETGLLEQKNWRAKWITHTLTNPKGSPAPQGHGLRDALGYTLTDSKSPLARSASDTGCPDGYTLTDSKSPLARSASDTGCPDGYDFLKEETACPIFVKEYAFEKKIRRARAYVTSLGVYELCVNGKKAGDAYLAPGWTSYHNRLQYQTYDITDLLVRGLTHGKAETAQKSTREGDGEMQKAQTGRGAESTCKIELTVANGWYKGYLNGEGENCFYGDRVAALAMFRVEYEDGTHDMFGTDESWNVTTGIVEDSELYHGEIQDFTRETATEEGNAVLFDVSEKVTRIVAQESEPVCVIEEVAAKEKIITPKGEIVIDFGQNLPGFVRVELPPLTGDKLVIRHAETLDKEGNFYTANLRTAKCRDIYIYNSEQIGKVVAPHFTYRGFRYICLEGVGEDIEIGRFTACVLHTDMEKTGSFTCDNEKVNRLQENIVWGQRSNFVDIPTDCPQRDERLGWTGDAQIFCRTAMFNYQSALFYRKWLRDVAVETDDEHGVPHVVPNIVGPSTGTAVWSDCATVIPWTAYLVYGDEEILREQYANMRQWVEYIRRSCGEDVLWMNGFQRGDWLALDSDESLHLMSGGTDKNLVANVYYAYSVKCVRDAAKVLGKRRDAAVYGELYDSIVEELNQEYVTRNGRLVSETQTACALLLYFDLIKEEYRKRVVKILEDNLSLHRGHLTTGFVGTAYLCHVLSENGRHDLAEELLLNEEYPGWLYAVNMGATTIWERWNSVLPNGNFDESGMNSLNHYTYGSIGDWLYRKVAGINPLAPGYKKILIRPILTKSIMQMDASYETMYGTVEVHLTCRDGQIVIDLRIPANTTAVLELPERDDEIELGSGSYHFAYETETDLRAGKITMNSTLGQVLALPGGEEAFEEVTGRPIDPSMRNYLQEKTLSQLAAMMPGGERMIGAVYEKVKVLAK